MSESIYTTQDTKTIEEEKEKIVEILKNHGIKIDIGGCGCCGSPWVTFEYKGEIIIKNKDNFNIDMFDDNI
jgi:Fe-S oxidoreductase